MAIKGIGDKITISIEGVSLELRRGEELLSFYRYTIAEQTVRVGRTIFGTATISGVGRLTTRPKQAWRATLRLNENLMRLHEAIFDRQQELTATRVNPAIILDDFYQYQQDFGAIRRPVAPGSELDSTSAPGFVRYFTRLQTFYDPLPDDRFIKVSGTDLGLVHYQFEVSGVEI